MAEILKKIFLSASIPSPERDKKYYQTADFIAIRESVRALAMTVIPKTILVWGGHPSITPIITNVLQSMECDINKHVLLYQSNFFEGQFPHENKSVGNIIKTEIVDNDKEQSVDFMRTKMIFENDYYAGIFIGGMDGVEKEFDMFMISHPNALKLPLATTGAAAKFIYERNKDAFQIKLEREYSYRNLYNSILKI